MKSSESGEGVNIVPLSRVPRQTIEQLISLIDRDEIRSFNEELCDELNDAPQGAELI
ncbi:hypothetical protein [Xenorhabdus hominickii]|uniref:Antitoxin n=1 Tax=Xenorhabdus hominickii TaxID=351679 RepID=A0A2G0Q4I9_XENHO|nr:hypothetical protein [Xenorhabdus hominickii]PHM54136.1 antitoxin [Xenorhabdus hominickii]